MRVALDTTCLQRTTAGTATMVRGFLTGMLEAELPVEYSYLAPPFAGLRNLGPGPRKVDTLVKDLIWTRKVLPRKLKKGTYDLFHAPYNHLPENIPLPFVVNVLDLYIRKHPEAFTPWAVKQYLRSEQMLQKAARLVCISEFTRHELLTLCPDLEAEKVKTVHLAPSHHFAPRSEEKVNHLRAAKGLEGPYVIWVGTVEPRKNIAEILEAVVKEPCLRDLQFVLVGRNGWVPSYVERVEKLVADHPNIHRPGFVSNEVLATLYSGAEALLFPSYYEGFGLPVLEAMACGCPVIAAEGSSLDEVCGGHAVQLEAENPEGWTDALLQLLAHPLRSPEKSQALQSWSATFSWTKSARKLYKIYSEVL